MDPSPFAERNQALLRSGQSVSHKRIKAEVWEQHRPEIFALYNGEGKTLAETKAILEKQYGFQAR